MALRKPRNNNQNFGDRKHGCAMDSSFEEDKRMFRALRLTKYCHRIPKEKPTPRKAKSSFWLTKKKYDAHGIPYLDKKKILIPEQFRIMASDVSLTTRSIILNLGKIFFTFTRVAEQK